MAHGTDVDSLHDQIHRDIQASDNAIPLSPQWLLPKPGDINTGMATGENSSHLFPGYASHPDAIKLHGKGNDLSENHKKKDVFRPSVLDMDSGRRDRWRDEERDVNLSARKDRWREGEKEHFETRKVVRKFESSVKHIGESRRVPGDRWVDSGNRENHDQHRERKWNTHWGRDDKESSALHEKWGDSSKEDEVLLDKGSSRIPHHGKDERDVDHPRPWRSNSSYSRGRSDANHQTSATNKQVSSFFHGTGRAENPPYFSAGRGKFSSVTNSATPPAINMQSHGPVREKSENGPGEPYPRSYSRTKLIDIYKTTDVLSYANGIVGVVQVPSLTQEAPIEPLVFCAPTPEELVILKGIDNGEINSSGAPQVSKDGSVGRVTENVQLRRNRLGSKDDLPVSLDDANHETLDYPGILSNERRSQGWSNAKVETMQEYPVISDHKLNAEASSEDSAVRRRNDDASADVSWRSSSFAERSRMISDWRELSTDVHKDANSAWETGRLESPMTRKGENKWPLGEDPITKKLHSAAFGREMERPKIPQLSPEDLVLFYKDPQGVVQGPFSGSDIITWFESGYFGLELQVRLASARDDTPFSLLEDVMPHLRAKARPPPGFNTSKANENQDVSGGSQYSSFGKPHAVPSDADVLKNDSRYKHVLPAEAENRFLESLMAGSMSAVNVDKFLRTEGMQGYGGQDSFSLSSLGSNIGDDRYMVAQKLALERQRSLQNPYSHWPGRDEAPFAANTDVVNENLPHHSKLLSSFTDNAPSQHLPQNLDSMSVLQGLPDRSASAINNGISGMGTFSIQGGLNPLQDNLDIRHGQNFTPQSTYPMQHQRLQSQNGSLSHLLAQSIENSTNGSISEKLLASGVSQDPQILSLLQQQYLLQLQSQVPVPSPQLSVLEKFLLIKQQQKQEEQQLMLQQQQLLSKLISEHQQYQQLGEASFAQQGRAFAAGSANADRNQFQQTNELVRLAAQSLSSNMGAANANVDDFVLPPGISRDTNFNIDPESVMPLPHLIHANNQRQSNWDSSMQIEEDQKKSGFTIAMDSTVMSDMANMYLDDKSNYESAEVAASNVGPNIPAEERLGESIAVQQFAVGYDNETVDTSDETVPQSCKENAEEHKVTDALIAKEIKIPESREVKKSSEKKSKKQKPSNITADSVGVLSKTQSWQVEATKHNDVTVESPAAQEDALPDPFSRTEKKTNKFSDDMDFQPGQNSSLVLNHADDGLKAGTKSAPGQAAWSSQENSQVQSGQNAWKPAPGFKPKSLLEIQQEEQRRSRVETVSDISASVSSSNISSPWAGIVVIPDQKSSNDEIGQDAVNSKLTLQNKKSLDEDLFWDNYTAKSRDTSVEPPTSSRGLLTDSTGDSDFIDAKDTKKSRKKSTKAKTAAAKTVPVAVVDVSVGSSPTGKGKNARLMPHQKEVLPAVPSGPSLGDFVLWKGESASPPAPAWFSDSGKPSKPASLRDILKEQEKKISSPLPMPTPRKPATNPPPMAASPVQIKSGSTHLKTKVEDDLFWGPLEQPNREDKQLDYPQLGAAASREVKNSPSKATLGGSLNRQKLGGGKQAEASLFSSVSSAQSLQIVKKGSLTKHSEALDFKKWCESECARLIGSKDTSILEYCLKISRPEAETLLIENLGSVDPKHDFIDKFLNYKDFLPANVVEIAFSNRNDQKTTAAPRVEEMTSDHVDAGDGTAKGGKKKGKKGKKVSSALLGFNVVSNRIMMGEIQTLDD